MLALMSLCCHSPATSILSMSGKIVNVVTNLYSQHVYMRVVQVLALFPGPKRRRRKGLVSAVRACANRGGIPPLPHTIDILPYDCDARIDTKRNTARRFMIVKYGMQETHWIVLIQQPIQSYKQTV